MPNYSIQNVRRPDTTAAKQYLAGLTPLQSAYFEENPGPAYESYIQRLKPSQSMERYMRSLYEALRADWYAKVSDMAQEGIDFQWADYLRETFNPQQRINMAEPQTRFESPGRFEGRARTIAF